MQGIEAGNAIADFVFDNLLQPRRTTGQPRKTSGGHPFPAIQASEIPVSTAQATKVAAPADVSGAVASRSRTRLAMNNA